MLQSEIRARPASVNACLDGSVISIFRGDKPVTHSVWRATVMFVQRAGWDDGYHCSTIVIRANPRPGANTIFQKRALICNKNGGPKRKPRPLGSADGADQSNSIARLKYAATATSPPSMTEARRGGNAFSRFEFHKCRARIVRDESGSMRPPRTHRATARCRRAPG